MEVEDCSTWCMMSGGLGFGSVFAVVGVVGVAGVGAVFLLRRGLFRIGMVDLSVC